MPSTFALFISVVLVSLEHQLWWTVNAFTQSSFGATRQAVGAACPRVWSAYNNRQDSESLRLEFGHDESPSSTKTRRAVLSSFVNGAITLAAASRTNAAIDVSGLRVEGGSPSPLAEQLRAYDGSAPARAQQLKALTTPPTTTTQSAAAALKDIAEPDPTVATWAYRSAPGFSPRLSRAGPLGTLSRYEDTVVPPAVQEGRQRAALTVSFEFPSDWLQLDKFLGGISYVDQRNGDRLYVLKTRLPPGQEELATVPKSFIGTSVFDPQGTIVNSQGIEVDEYRVTSARVLTECPDKMCATRRRFKIKYFTVTGNGLRVERRALVDAYQVSDQGDVYMLMTSSNAIKFDAKGRERETVEAIVDSFRVEV